MQEIYIGNGQTEYPLHSLLTPIPSLVHRGLEGLDGPSIRLDAYDNPGIAGQTVAQSLPGGSLIQLEGTLRTFHTGDQAADIASYLSERRKLAEALTHTYNSLGRAQPLILRFTDQMGRQLKTKVFKERYSAPLELPTHNRWRLQLRNPSGVIFSQTTNTATVGIPIQGGVNFDLVWDIVFGESTGGIITVNNQGSAPAKPVIRLVGPIANPVITNATTNEVMALNYSLSSGGSITIDAESNTIIQGQSTNRMGARKTGSVFWELQPGQNTITLQADFSTAGYAQIEWEDTYGGF